MFTDPLVQMRNQILQSERDQQKMLIDAAVKSNQADLLPKLLEDNAKTFEDMRNEYRVRGMNI